MAPEEEKAAQTTSHLHKRPNLCQWVKCDESKTVPATGFDIFPWGHPLRHRL